MPSPVVELNRAVAVSMATGPQAGLDIVDDLVARGELNGYYLLHSTRAELLARLDRPHEAAREFRQAIDLAGNDVERSHLQHRLSEMPTH
jgi:RNA polymerase sigma-70 factor (ECF subfamily)